MKTLFNNLLHETRRRIGNLRHAKPSVASVLMHSAVCVGTAVRVLRVTSNLGRALTPFDLGIVVAAFTFEALRAEIVYRLVKN